MTPKEKAKELVYNYNFLKEIFIPSIHEQKRCALIAVDEILNSNPHIYIERVSIGGDNIYNEAKTNRSYWKEVKEEIERI
jgi:hypothetical protein